MEKRYSDVTERALKFLNDTGNGDEVPLTKVMEFLAEKGVNVGKYDYEGGRQTNRNFMRILSCSYYEPRKWAEVDRLRQFFIKTDGFYGKGLESLGSNLGIYPSGKLVRRLASYCFDDGEHLSEEDDTTLIYKFLHYENLGPLSLEIVQYNPIKEGKFSVFMFRGEDSESFYLDEIRKALGE
jgi:hypothetical protein